MIDASAITPLAAGFVSGIIIGFTWGFYKGKKDFYKMPAAHFKIRRK